MSGRGILDAITFSSRKRTPDGDIVAARIGDEATIKTLRAEMARSSSSGKSGEKESSFQGATSRCRVAAECLPVQRDADVDEGPATATGRHADETRRYGAALFCSFAFFSLSSRASRRRAPSAREYASPPCGIPPRSWRGARCN